MIEIEASDSDKTKLIESANKLREANLAIQSLEKQIGKVWPERYLSNMKWEIERMAATLEQMAEMNEGA